MRNFKDLIKELCPDGVKFEKIDDLVTIKRGERVTKNDLIDDGNYKVISGGAEPMGYYNKFNREKNTITISSYGYAGYVNFITEDFWANDVCLCIYPKSNIDNKFLYYSLKNKQNYFFSKTTKAIPDHIPTEVIKETSIAVPPLEVQHEIVNILDTFEEHIECLKKELELRESSYETIMHSLLRKGNFKKFDCLENYCRFEKGKTPIQKNTPGSYPLVATTEHLQTSDNYQFDCEAVCLPLISARGHGVASITRIYYQSGKFALGNILCAIIPKDNQIKAEFLRNYLFYHKDTLLVPLMRGGANVSLTIDSLKKVQIPIPSIEEQQGIIEKLRIFQEILSKEKGIPAEIEKRQQQYEYYREKLLSFKEVEEDE